MGEIGVGFGAAGIDDAGAVGGGVEVAESLPKIRARASAYCFSFSAHVTTGVAFVEEDFDADFLGARFIILIGALLVGFAAASAAANCFDMS